MKVENPTVKNYLLFVLNYYNHLVILTFLVLIIGFVISSGSFFVGYKIGNKTETFDDGDDYLPDPYPFPVELNRTDPNLADVLLTKQFKIKVNKTDFKNRNEGLERYNKIINEVFGFDLLVPGEYISDNVKNKTKPRQNVYSSKTYNTSLCGIEYDKVFIENYFWEEGHDYGFMEFGIHQGFSDEENSLEFNNFRANSIFYDNSTQRLEQEIKPCGVTYTRKVSIDTDQKPPLDTCQDLMVYFPDLFPSIENPFNKIDKIDTQYWYKVSWKGTTLHRSADYKVIFKFRYDNKEDAIEGITTPIKKKNSFEIRLYGSNHGLDNFCPEFQQPFVDQYNELVQILNPDYAICDEEEQDEL